MKKRTDVRLDENPEDASKYLGMRKRWWQRLVLIKDGSIQGWFISFVFTMFTMIVLGLGFFIPKIADAWVKFGYNYATIYLGSTGMWLTYKVAKHKYENGTPDLGSIVSAVTNEMQKSDTKPLEKQ